MLFIDSVNSTCAVKGGQTQRVRT